MFFREQSIKIQLEILKSFRRLVDFVVFTEIKILLGHESFLSRILKKLTAEFEIIKGILLKKGGSRRVIRQIQEVINC